MKKETNPSKIVVQHLNLHYGENHALKDINMNIAQNAVTAFIGPSGCGKSTFLKCLNRMNDLVDCVKIDGTVTIDGEDIYSQKVDTTLLRKKVGMVFQQPNPFPMSIYDNIAYGPRIHGITAKAKLDDIVERSLRDAAIFEEVKDRLKKSALGLSGGQQQRLCIARALAVEPEILLMDEPLSALDAELKIDMRREIQNIHKLTGATILYVTHDQSEALAMADRILIMKNGKIEQVGTPEEIYLHPQTEFAASFVSKCNFVRGQWNDSYFKVMDQSLIYDGPEVAQAFKNHGLFPVRPEQFHIVKEGKGIPATVTNRQYSGREIHYSLKCGEDTFTVYAGSREQYEPGEQVKLVYQAS